MPTGIYWCSWAQPTEDYRPIKYPPRKEILGWWCSGYDSSENAVLCAAVVANSEEQAREFVEAEWPEFAGKAWRFCEPKPHGWTPSDRFPLSDWMKARFCP